MASSTQRDDDLRNAAFAALDVLQTQHGPDLPVRGVLSAGFAFDGGRVPFLNPQQGIFRAARQRGPAALSVVTSWNSPYDDAAGGEGLVWYAFRAPHATGTDPRDNAQLRAAHALAVPIAYFVAAAAGVYRVSYPVFAADVDEVGRRVLLDTEPRAPGPFAATTTSREYALRIARWRLHQGRFRTQVLGAYRTRCAICRLKERSLLDAAHIVGDARAGGEPVVDNGLSLCSIHHRAYDGDLVSVTPAHRVAVSRRLLTEIDGPMLALLKGFHGAPIELPRRPGDHPDRDRLAARHAEFVARGG